MDNSHNYYLFHFSSFAYVSFWRSERSHKGDLVDNANLLRILPGQQYFLFSRTFE